MADKIIERYYELFGEYKSILDIARECTLYVNKANSITFSIKDFIDENIYINTLNEINMFRKYLELDKLLNNMEEGLMSVTFNAKIDYKMLIQAMDIFEKKFNESSIAYFKISKKREYESLNVMDVKTIDDVFADDKSNIIYNITSSNNIDSGMYYLNCYREYMFVTVLPFHDTKETINISGYVYLLNQYIESNYESFDFNKKYTTLNKEFNIEFNEYIKDYNDKFLYKRIVSDFIDDKSVNFKEIGDYLYGIDIDEYEYMKADRLSKYFKNLKFNISKIDDFIKNNWFILKDIGYLYEDYIDYNKIYSIESLVEYKDVLMEKKRLDILFNLYLYKALGSFKFIYNYNMSLKLGLNDFNPNEYSQYILKYLTSDIKSKIDLDNNEIFKYGNSFVNYEHKCKCELFEITAKNNKYHIEVDLLKFIDKYNECNNMELKLNSLYSVPIHYINYYVSNNILPLGKLIMMNEIDVWDIQNLYSNIALKMFINDEEFNFICERLMEISKPVVEQKKNISICKSRFGVPCEDKYIPPVVIYIDIPYKEYVKIKNGKHKYFESKKIEGKMLKNSI